MNPTGQAHPLRLNVLLREAQADLAQGRPLEAALRFGAVREHSTRAEQRTDALIGLADVLERTEDFSTAERVYADILRTHPEQPDVLANRSRLLVRMGRYEDALALIEPALEKARPLSSHHHPLVLTRAIALRHLGRPAEALEALNEILRTQPDETIVQFHKGLTLLALGQRDDACPLIARALKTWPHAPTVQAVWREHFAQTGDAPSPSCGPSTLTAQTAPADSLSLEPNPGRR